MTARGTNVLMGIDWGGTITAARAAMRITSSCCATDPPDDLQRMFPVCPSE